MDNFLKATEVIDWNHPSVIAKVQELSHGTRDTREIARRCFEWVRDHIQHSSDFKRNPVTCNASDVLREGTGYCYAKSHLLGALLRANDISAGFCYQRLSIDETGPPYSLHGLNACACQNSAGSKPEVAISVEDKGIGISSADLAHVFEPFYRAQSVRDNQIRGVGLGLYLVKRMMEDMGGRVSVTSEIGRGTVVVLHFPVASFTDHSDGSGA